jgi:hypothetical protein
MPVKLCQRHDEINLFDAIFYLLTKIIDFFELQSFFRHKRILLFQISIFLGLSFKWQILFNREPGFCKNQSSFHIDFNTLSRNIN